MPYRIPLKTEREFQVVLEPDGDFPLPIEGDSAEPELSFNLTKFGWYIRWMREQRRLSIRDACKVSGLSTGHLSRIETAKIEGPPSMRIIKKIAGFLNVGTDTLLLMAGVHPLGEPEDNGELSPEDEFADLVLHDCLQPAGLKRSQLKWLAPEWKRLWVEHSRNLVRAIQAGEELPEWLTADDGVTP
jgi:transcriptional regulator with XRE-family HTH domain